MLSICTTIKNRSRLTVDGSDLQLFPRCVESITSSVGNLPCELVVSDWHSDDWPLERWLPQAASPISVQILQLDGTFSRGKGLNTAARASTWDTLFFMDTDALLCDKVICSGIEHVRDGRAYFPIIYAYGSRDHAAGRWCDGGYGHCFISKNSFEAAGGWPEYSSWGREDKEFWASVSSRQPVVRERVAGFCHQWHPEDPDWKNRYGETTPAFEQTKAKVIATQSEVAASNEVFAHVERVLPPKARYILVDEDRFIKPAGSLQRISPFLERDGQYWGIPADNSIAIAELQRLHATGARFVVFPWITFWWLDHFQGLRGYLRSMSVKVLDDERVLIFDLGPPGDIK